jgi:hypothetical protein
MTLSKGKASIRNRIGRLEGWNISSEIDVKQRERNQHIKDERQNKTKCNFYKNQK